MAFDVIDKYGREILLKRIIEVCLSNPTEIEKLLALCWLYELIMSAVAEKANISVVAYQYIVKHLGNRLLPFMQALKNMRDKFIHNGVLPTGNLYTAISDLAIKSALDEIFVLTDANEKDKEILIDFFTLL